MPSCLTPAFPLSRRHEINEHFLVEEESVTFSEKAFSFLAGKDELQLLFVAKNIDSFLTNEEKFSVTDDFREKLLDSAIGDERRLKVIDKLDLTALGGSAHRALLVGRIIHRTDADVRGFVATIPKLLISG